MHLMSQQSWFHVIDSKLLDSVCFAAEFKSGKKEPVDGIGATTESQNLTSSNSFETGNANWQYFAVD